MRFSLVVATLGRADEVRALLTSLSRQIFADFEVILVDQNPDDRLVPVVRSFERMMRLRHCRTPVKGLSRARNVGLRIATGEILGFPDDDCVYPPSVLAFVDQRFAEDPCLATLSGPAVSPSGAPGSGRWTAAAGAITLASVWTSVIAFNFFIRAEALQAVGPFDETLGVGARFGSAEETDLALRVIKTGRTAVYDPALQVVHPDKRLSPEATLRAFRYGSGLGRVLRKHRAPPRITLVFLVRPLGGILWGCAVLRPMAARYYWNTLAGRVAGYLATA